MAPRNQGEHPTQVPPQNQTQQQVSNPDHIEQFDYRKTPITDVPETELLGKIPHETSDELTQELKSPAVFRENPISVPAPVENSSTKEQKKRFTRKQKLLAGIAAGAAGVVVGVLPFAGSLAGGTKSVETDDGLLVPQDVATAPIVPGENQSEHSLDPLRAQDVERGQTLLTKKFEQSVNELRNKGFDINPGTPSDDNTNKEIADQYAVNIYSVWLLSKESTSEAATALKAVINPEGASYDDYVRTTELFNHPGGIESVTRDVLDWTKNFYNTNYKDVPANGNAMRVLTVQYTDDLANQITFRRDSNDGPWSVQKMVTTDPNEPDFVSDLREVDKYVS